MSGEPVCFVKNENNAVLIKGKYYVVLYTTPTPLFFGNQPQINVDGKKYPLEYKGYRLCDDLRYRKSPKDALAFSGPYSAFSPVDSDNDKPIAYSCKC